MRSGSLAETSHRGGYNVPEKQGDSNGLVPGNSIWHRLTLIGAVVASIATGALSINGTTDRYRASDAEKDFKPINIEISNLKERIKDLKYQVEKIEDDHPPQSLVGQIRDIENRLKEIELDRARRNGP